MVWFKVDDTLAAHPKARRAGLAAMGLWTVAGAWSAQQLTDGFVPAWYVETWPSGRKLAGALVSAGLWTPETVAGDKGWQFHQWSDRNPTRKQVEDEREAAKERMKKARDRKRADQKRSGEVRANVPANEQENVRENFGDRSPSGRSVAPSRRDGSTSYSVPLADQLATDLASVDAHDERDPDHGPAGALSALYAVGVPMTDHGRAHRVIAAALDHYAPDLVRRGVLQLIAEDRACTPDTLRIAIHASDPQASAQAGQPKRRTATEKANGWLTVGLESHEQAPSLRAITGGAS